MNHNIITTSSMIMTRKTQIMQTNNMASASERNSLVGSLLSFLTTLVMLFSVGVSGAWAFNDFEIDLTTSSPVLPTGVTQISYPQNGAGHNSAQHGWYWYAIQFDVDGPVDIFLGCCQHAGTTAQLTDGAGNVIAESIDTQTPGCNGLVKYSYTGGAKTLRLYCGNYCPYIRVAKTPTSNYTAAWDWTTMTPAALNQTIQSASKWLPSNQDGVSMYVGAASGKCAANGDNAQFITGTKLIIPVYSTEDKLSVVGYPGMTHISIHGTEYTQDVENLAVSSLDVAQGFIEITSTADNGYLKKVTLMHTASTPAERTFEDFKIDFRSNPYNVVAPAEGLPQGVEIGGSFHDVQHGYSPATITVPVDGPVKFTIGSCQYGSPKMKITDSEGNVLEEALDTNNGCDNNTSTDHFIEWTYNIEASTTLTFQTSGYLPFFYAEKCDYVANITVTYHNIDKSELGMDVVAANSTLTYKFGAGSLDIPSGKAFRGWANENGVKVPEGKVLTENIDLYPVITDIETAAVGKTFEYDLTKSAFDPLDHDLISMTGKYYNNHGWIFSNGQTLQLQVAGNAIVQLGLCQYSNESNITVTDGSGNTVGTIAAKAGADGATSSINYKGAATTLTFTMANTTYVHSVKVYNVETIPEKVDGRYTVTAGNADNLLLTLAIAKPGDVIYLPNGIYDLGTVTQTNITDGLHLIGESQNGVVIKNQPTEESINLTSTLKITGEDVTLEKLTIKCRAPYGITTGGATSDAERGVCVEDKGNNTHYINVTLDGLQDTYYSNGAKKMKATFDDCVVRGNVDFFCGSGNITVNNSRLQIVTTHTTGGTAIICAPATYTDEAQGYVFNNCVVEAATSDVDCLTPGHSSNMKFNLARAWYAGNDGIDRTPRVTFNGTEFDIEPIEKWGGSIGNVQTEERREFTYVSKEIEFSDEAKVIDKTNKPFGFVTATDRTSPTSIDLSKITGGGAVTIEEALALAAANDPSVTTLTSDGVTPKDNAIKDAIRDYKIIIFDGGSTEATKKFIVSEVMQIKNLQDKTFIGINGARLCTEFFITERYKYLLDNAGVKGASTASGTGGTFKYKNGKEVTINEQEEYLTRLTLYNAVEDAWEKKAKAANGGTLPDDFQYKNSEPYINAGIFYFDNCQNFVIRNLKLEGPGSVDVGGTDLMSIINGSHHFWVDHCEFTDGIDGNFDITNGSDFVTVSWCKFSYTERAYAHENSNLVGSDDSKDAMDTNHLNITYAYNEWGKGCDGRMPMARFGKIHMLNNYYTCGGNTQNAMNPRKNSEFLIEGNLWAKGVTKTYKEDGALAVTWGANNTIKSTSGTTGTNKGTQPVTVPYDYNGLVLDVVKLPEVLELNGGAVLGTSPVFTTDLPSEATASLTEAREDGITLSVWAENAHTFQWYIKTKDLQGNYSDWTKIDGATRNSYTYKTTRGELIKLQCVAFGVSGSSTSNTITLTILDDAKPAFILDLDDSETKSVTTGEPLELNVNAGDPATGVTYQWYKYSADSDKSSATAIDGATSMSYSYNPAAAEVAYIFCCATNSKGSTDSKAVKVKGTFRDIKFHYFGKYNYTAGNSEEEIHGGIGGLETFHTDCTGSCTAGLNSMGEEELHNKVSGIRFANCTDGHETETKFAANTYVEFTLTEPLVAGHILKLSGYTGATGSPANNYGFYVCTGTTKTAENTIATLALSKGKNILEEAYGTINETFASGTKLYVIPFVNESGKNVTVHDVMVYASESVPYEDVAITTDLEDSYKTTVNKSVTLQIEAIDAASYQWYKNTEKSAVIDDEHKIAGATNATLEYTPSAEGTEYLYCYVTGSKLGTFATSKIAAVIASPASTSDPIVWIFDDFGKDNFDDGKGYAMVPFGTTTVVSVASGKELKFTCEANKESSASRVYTGLNETVGDNTVKSDLYIGGSGSLTNRIFVTDALSGSGTLTIVYTAGTVDCNVGIYDNANTETALATSAITKSTAYDFKLKNLSDTQLRITHSGKARIGAIIWTPKQTAILEKGIYSTTFDNWTAVSVKDKENVDATTQTYKTKDNQTLVFTLKNTSVVTDSKGDSKITHEKASIGALKAAKESTDAAKAYVETSALNSITKVYFLHGATSSNRGWGLMVKGTNEDGTQDPDWVTLSDATANPNTGQEVTVNVNRTNCQLRFYNLDKGNYAIMTDLVIYGMMEMSNCEEPTSESVWDAPNEKWNYTFTSETETAHLKYTIDGGEEQTVEAATNSTPIALSPGQEVVVWAVDSEETLPKSTELTVTAPAMPKTTKPVITVDKYSVANRSFNYKINGVASGAKIYYTTDGTDPTAESTLYTQGETGIDDANGGFTIKAIAVCDHYNNSDIVSASVPEFSIVGSEKIIMDNGATSKSPNSGTSYTVPGDFNAGTYSGSAGAGIKYNAGTLEGNERNIVIDANPGFVIRKIETDYAITNGGYTAKLAAIYANGDTEHDVKAKEVTLAKSGGSTTANVIATVDGLRAHSLDIRFTSDDASWPTTPQLNIRFIVYYEVDDAPASVVINGETMSDEDFNTLTTSGDNTVVLSREYNGTPDIVMNTEKGYVHPMNSVVSDDAYHKYQCTILGTTYTIKAMVDAIESPFVAIDSKVSVAGGYKLTVTPDPTDGTIPMISVDGGAWELYDSDKTYYAVKYVKTKTKYTRDEVEKYSDERTTNCPESKYEIGKPFAVFVRQPSYLDSQDGSNPYNSLAPEANDKIYQALQKNFNVVDFVKPSSTEVLKEMPDIAEAKLVVITEMISGSGSYQMQRPQDKEVLDTKSTALTMTLLRDVVDKTNVINFKMFTYSQSKNNTDRWGWAMPAALPSGIISINPVEPNGGGMYELFSEARMNVGGTITLWDNINEDKNLNHLQPVFNFAEGEHVPNFIPLALAVDPDNQEEEYHILHYYDKTTNGKKTTYVGFGLSVNEWTAYNDNLKAIIEKMGEMIIAGRPLNSKLDHIVDPNITDNGDGSATVMNNNFSATTYYLAKNKDEDAPDATTIETTGSQSLAENDYHTQKYTTDKILYVVSKLGTAYSNVVSAPIKGSVIRYINRVNDDPEATGLEARYPFEVNKDGSAKAFDFPYNQSWKKDGYTVTKWIDVNNGTEYIPGQSCSNLTGEITVKAVWTKNAHEITDLSKYESEVQRTVTWEFLPSKGAPMIQIEEKNGKYPLNAILVGQAKFKDGTWIDVPLDIYANPAATTTPEGKAMPDGGKFVNRAFYDKKPGTYEKDYAQVRTGTQMKMPAVYGMLLKYHQMDMHKVDTTALKEMSQSYITQSYVTDGTTTGETQNKWVVRNPGLKTTNGVIDLDDNKKPTIKLNNLADGGEILYEGEGLVATLNTVESAVFTEHDDKNKEGRLNEGSCFMDKLEVTYPALYELTCTWIAVGNETNPNKSELDPEENPGKIEKLNDSHANCNGRYLLDYPVYLKLTPSYGYYVDVDNAEVKDEGGNVTTPAYFFFKNGKDATEALSGDDLHIYRYKDPGYAGYSDEIKAKIPVDGAYIEMNVRDIDLYVSMKKVTTRTYSITAYPGDMGVIEYNTGNGRTPENEYKQFPDGKTIVVTAAPKMGYKFKEWRLNPEEKNPTTTGTVVDEHTEITGITFGTGKNTNPLVGKSLEKNELAVVVNSNNASNDKKYYAIFEEGVEGIANYQFANALEQYVDGEGHIQYRSLELGDDAINAFPTSYKSTALNIPRYYTLYKEGYTLDHWVENTTPDEAQPTLGKTYDIGTFYYFDNKDENRYLIPVFTKDPVSYDHRAVPVDITWDFRSSKFAQRMNFNTKDDGGKYKTQSIFYSTHAVINNEHLMDVPLQITLGNKGKLQNNTDDEWCAIGEGTEIVIPSGIGAKFTIASLSPMTTTSFIEKDAFGNVVNSTVPTSYTRKNENDIDVYYYTFTTQSTSTNITLKIGDDYSYYKSIRAELPAADAVPLKVTVNNPAFGGSELTKAIHTDGTSHLDQINKTYTALPESEGNGGVYTLGLGTTVTLHAKRNHLYVVDYIEDHFGTKYTWSNSNPGNIKAVSADGTDVSTTAYSAGMSMAKVTDVLGANNDIEFTFQVNTYDNRMHIVYKENTLYQINYTSGEEAEGEAPGIKLIEEGESFTVPAENHYLYVDGQTLKYWVDEDGNKYDFGQSYIPGQHFTASKDLPSGFKSGEGFDVPLDNLFLTPHFDVNDFTVMNLTEEATAVWPLTRLGKSGSDDPNGNYPGNDDVVIYFQKSVGIYVTPLKLADGRFIDLKLDMNCAKTGKIDNQNNGERCQINGESTVSVPSSSNCDISLYTVNGKLSTTVIAGATAKEDGKEGDKVVATKYTSTTVSGSNDVATVAYTGSNTMVDIDFMGEAGYFYQIAATYKPVTTTLPELDYVTIDNIALGALGTGLAEKKLSTLKTEGQVEGVVADLRTSKSGNMPVVKAQATNNGYVEITPATIDNPVATLLVKTRDGVTVSVHKIFFNVTPPVTAPIITDLRIGSQYQCDIEKIDGDAMFINNNWDDVYPEGSYIYGYKDKADDNTDKVTDKYILNVADAGINGAIAIRFNKPMKEANVKVEELGQTIHAEEGQTLVFSYWGLDLNTNYDFIIPANTLEDVYGNKYAHTIRINFTTVEHAVEVENRLINFVVTHNQPVKWDQETFSMVPDGAIQQVASDELIANLDAAGIAHGTISEGVKMANDAKSNNDRFYIFVPDGEYQLQGNTSIQANFASGTYAPADNTGKLRDELLYKSNGNRPVWNGITEIARGNVSITGQSQDKTIVWNRPEIEGISYTATFRLNNGTSNFYAQDMTWENRFDYKTSIGKQGAASAQAARAVVLQDRSSKSVFKNVNMMSYQDTYYSNPTGQNEDTRYYFENCTLGGYVDFLCGDGDVWLEKCDLVLRQGKGTNACNIMAPRQYPTQEWGYVFNRCNIKAEEDAYNINNGKFTLGRPWQNSPASSLLYTTYHVLPTTDAYKQMSETGKVLRMHEFRSYMPDGTLVDLSQRSLRNSSPGAGSYDAVMTPSEAERYTVFNAMGGNDGYDPTIYTRQVSMKNNNFGQDDTALSWDKEPEALCYFIFRKDNETDEEWKLFAVTEDTEFELDDRQLDKWFCVRAANQRGGLGEPTQAYQYKAHESYNRELIDNAQVIDGWRWSTIYLDFDAKAPVVQHQKMVDGVPAVGSSDKPVMEDEIYVYALVKVDATKLTFKRVKIMEKNCGYLIKARPRPEEYEFKYTEKTPVYHNDMTVAEYEQWRTDQSGEEVDMSHMSLMNGSVTDKTAAGTAGYTLASKVSYGLGFYKYVGKQYNANYAWIDAALVAEAQKAMADGSLDAAAKAGYMMMVFEDDSVDGDSNISTDLDGIREHESNDDNIYNLNGQRINASQMQRGQIYIINGKKIRK